MKAILEGTICYVGVGSNEEDPLALCRDAIDRIATLENTAVLRSSSFYRTEPVGYTDQPWFVNAVIEVRSLLMPRELLEGLQQIENEMGRVRDLKWGPRKIDLDMLLYGQEIIDEPFLKVPHPELHRRRFVLEPINEIASYALHPLFGISMKGLLGRLDDDKSVIRIVT